MKVLMGYFMIESNEHVPGFTELDAFNIKFEENLIDAMYVEPLFTEAGVDIIPAIYARGHSARVLSQDAFQYIRSVMIKKVKEHLSEIDGIYLFLHGASKVENLPEGSGDRQLLADIRALTGPYLPIAVVMDPHGNLTETYASQMTVGRCYRQSPHTDMVETFKKTAKMLVEVLQTRRYTQPVYRKLPFVLGGERSVSTDEPMLSINRKLDMIEQDSRIMSASFHVGYLRHDNYAAGSGILVIPKEEKYRSYAEQVADELLTYCIGKYAEFHYHGLAMGVDEAIGEAINSDEEHIVLTDSGDNVTSGAQGNNTVLLEKIYNLDNYKDKRILFAAITDKRLFFQLKKLPLESEQMIEVGNGANEFSRAIPMKVRKINQGELQEMYGDTDNYGETITVRVVNKPIDIVIIERSTSFTGGYQFDAANIRMSDYDIIIVKQGYIFPELKQFADKAIMILTDGPTNQVTEQLRFRQIPRPMLPFDPIN